MKTPDQVRLLRDVLHEESYVAFRNELRKNALADLRRQRRAAWRRPLLALAACVPFLAGLVFWLATRPSGENGSIPACSLVRSAPLTKEQLVTTRSAPFVEVVHTDAQQFIAEQISDEQLLGLFRGHSLALTVTGPGTKRLLFLDARDQSEFYGL